MATNVERPVTAETVERTRAAARGWRDGVARAILVSAWVLCALPWRPDAPWAECAGWSGTAAARSSALAPLLATTGAGLYRLALIGLIGVAAWRGLPGDRKRRLTAPVRLSALIIIVCAVAWLRYPALVGPVLLVPCAIVAVWGYMFGRALERGLGSMACWAALSLIAFAAGGGATLLELTDAGPVVTEAAIATPQDRERWRRMLKSADDNESSLVEFRLESSDLNLMAASWLTAHASQAALDIAVGDDDVRSRLTFPIRMPAIGNRFLNIDARFQPSVSVGELAPRLTQIRIGESSLPSPIVKRISEIVRKGLAADVDVRRSLPSIQSLRVDDHALLVLCEPERAARIVAESVEQSPAASDELRASVRAAMQHLVATAAELPEGDDRFLGLIRIAFAFAQQRSTAETAASENRAALIALGNLVGDPRLRRLMGFDPDERMTHFRYPFDRHVTLRKRNDLARHFFVSAALRSLSSDEWSFAVGLMKEQFDAAEGGSGFSCADLTADLAGVQFAQQATGANASARALQSRLAEPFGIDDLLPSIEGLPEGLSQAAFREQFGSLTDPRFLEMTVDIRDRMAGCDLLGVEPATKTAE